MSPFRFCGNPDDILVTLKLDERVDGEAATVEACACQPEALCARLRFIAHETSSYGWLPTWCLSCPDERFRLRVP